MCIAHGSNDCWILFFIGRSWCIWSQFQVSYYIQMSKFTHSKIAEKPFVWDVKLELIGAKIFKIIYQILSGHRGLGIDLGLQGPINKKRILERSQVIF